MESIGFKEWAIVCQALGHGKQSIILRKGGIAEGRAGFSFRYRDFFLFPTYFHGQRDKTRTNDIAAPKPNEQKIEVRFFARLEQTHLIRSWEMAEALEPLHILHPSVIRERFDYSLAGALHLALVRVFRLEQTWIFPNDKSYGGCRSWVRLPDRPAGMQLQAVLTNEEHQQRSDVLQEITRSIRIPDL